MKVQLGFVFGTVTFMVAAGAMAVAIIRKIISAIAQAMIAATRMFARTRIIMSTRFLCYHIV